MFKFNIGDVVVPKNAFAECLTIAKAGGFSLPKRMTIRERISVECCGGTQLFYQAALMGKCFEFAEAEIVLLNEDDLNPIIDAIVANKICKSTKTSD